MNQQSLHAIVKGRVQGVGYRYFVLTRARTLGLNGFARNNADGSVEVYAEGGAKDLRQFLEELEVGSDFSRVDTVEHSFGETESRITGFSIR